MRASGLDYQSLQAIKPDIILASATAYGEGGPDSHKVGFDGTGQVLWGPTYRQGLPEQPIRTVVPYTDFGTALTLTIGVLAALMHHDQTGEGQHVEGALLSTALMMSNAFLIERDLLGVDEPTHRQPRHLGGTLRPVRVHRRVGAPPDRRPADVQALVPAGRPMRSCSMIPRFADDDRRWENGDILNDLMQECCTVTTSSSRACS